MSTSGEIQSGGGGGGNVDIVSPVDGSGNVKVAQQGAIDIGTLPAVDIAAGQSVQVSNFPATQPVSGTVAISGTVAATLPAGTPYHLISAATTNATNVKGSGGSILAIVATNNNAAPRYLKVFNKATAPVPGTDTPVLNFEIPANGAGASLGAGFVLNVPGGISFALGIGFALTAGQADNDATAVAAGDINLNLVYA